MTYCAKAIKQANTTKMLIPKLAGIESRPFICAHRSVSWWTGKPLLLWRGIWQRHQRLSKSRYLRTRILFLKDAFRSGHKNLTPGTGKATSCMAFSFEMEDGTQSRARRRAVWEVKGRECSSWEPLTSAEPGPSLKHPSLAYFLRLSESPV